MSPLSALDTLNIATSEAHTLSQYLSIAMPDPLEYEEEDLFEEIGGPTENRPIAGPSRQPISAVPSSVGNSYLDPRKARLQSLYAKRKHESEREKVRSGVRSLKRMCIDGESLAVYLDSLPGQYFERRVGMVRALGWVRRSIPRLLISHERSTVVQLCDVP